MEDWTVSERERKVLEALYEIWEDDSNCRFMKYIAKDCRLKVVQVRRSLRSLARKGLTEYMRGLFSEDTGLVAGSGYCCTEKGAKWLEATRALETPPITIKVPIEENPPPNK